MKPEIGSEEMEEAPWDPMELFLDVGMLVIEARTPDNSLKGRVEGPHVPPTVPGGYPHKCDKHREQCRKADHLRKQMLMLCRNGIPMRIDVLLLPNCDHGQKEASSTDSAALPGTDDVMLLERWDIQILLKRSEKMESSSVTGRFLLQAIRSYLHFSQLSSWLISNRGYLPLQVVYRVYAPGENVSHVHVFNSLPDVHQFPVADLHTSLVKVGVSSLPRQQTIPLLQCKEEMQFFNKIPARKKISPDKEVPGSGTAQENLVKESMPWSKKTEELRKTSPELFKEKENYHSHGAIPKTKRSQPSHQTNIDHTERHRHHTVHKPPIHTPSHREDSDHMGPASHRISDHSHLKNLPPHHPHVKVKSQQTEHASVPRKTVPDKPTLSQMLAEFKPLDLRSPRDPKCLNMRLPSPKVLFTQSGSGAHTCYKKKELDFSAPPVEDRLMSEKISDLVKPLNSEELEAYLSSLSHPLKEKPTARTELKNIPTTKCKFYIGDDENSHISTSKSSPSTDIRCNLFPEDLQSDGTPMSQDTIFKFESNIKDTSPPKSPTQVSTFPPKCLFKKSLSEPGLSVDKLSLLQISTSPDEKLSDLDSSLARSFQDLPFFDKETSENGCSSDSSSTPTNSLSERNGAMTKYFSSQNSTKLRDSGQSRESTPTWELETSPVRNKKAHKDHRCNQSPLQNVNIPSLSDQEQSKPKKVNVGTTVKNDLPGETGVPKVDGKGSSLCKQLLRKELQKNIEDPNVKVKAGIPDCEEIKSFHQSLGNSSAMLFNTSTGLPSRSSPAPIKKRSSKSFDYDDSLINTRAIKNALSCSKLTLQSECRGTETENVEQEKVLSASAPASTNCLLGNFEESVLNGRIEPVGVVEGFTCEIGAGGTFCPKHLNLPVTAYFFQLSDDNAPSPYLGHINLEPLGKKGYRIPKCGTVQVTLFNPNKTVVKMFVVMYDLSDMPANCQTFLRQRTVYMPVDENSCEPSYLRYLIHLRFATTKSGKLYLHTDIRLIFARDKFEFDPRIAKYELRSFTEGPQNPKFSPKR